MEIAKRPDIESRADEGLDGARIQVPTGDGGVIDCCDEAPLCRATLISCSDELISDRQRHERTRDCNGAVALA
ncbi:MAG: hypothetical protein M3R46_14625 [Actinomycetota bacterium]|nr:hypothetical protein [Actinomycetota bacterium]